MSHPTPDTTFRPPRPRTRDLSTPQLRALRKELLLVRASVERAEMAEAVLELRETATRLKWLRLVATGFGHAGGRGGGVLGMVLKQYPLLASLASALFAKPVRKRLGRAIVPALKWGSLAFAAWEAWRVWKGIRREDSSSEPGEPAEAPNDSGY